ncbi:MAG: TolB-like 6-bladed beta-propeller domain-containing protein, partial [Bacteroidaceae bacterium]|nr:TolB-like 6-bladed beta-propeller domain-containing protein [Bacteroidaceae bacterium]
FIYALYYGGLLDSSDYDACPDILYVFDWNGNIVRKLRLDEHVTDVWLNGDMLYMYHRVRPNLYSVKIDDIV